MKQIKSWAQYYVDLMTKLGLVRFSMFLATAIIVLAVSIQMGVTLFLRGTVDVVDLVRSVFFGLLQPGGFLYLGHSESLPQPHPQLRLIGRTIYERTA